MDKIRLKSTKDLSHRQLHSLLRTFRPADAAFVLHLAQCERCRGVAPRLLPEANSSADGGYLESLSSLERDFVRELTRGSYLLTLADRRVASQDDVSPLELREFLESLGPEQTALIRHLLACQTCRDIATKTLAPRRGQSIHLSSISQADAIL